ncbi:WASP homolog-associated protein with actin, membranes and microtubules-like isoform X2 [Panonychus citri]|uniref:WASP homolog-associated protein with actin, membranes and microtubules-like isoform X2 n=1 Tax=Panonychus citri TaxID=50023 RepID=UPI0023071251|nr:WASP homolog-associated protein with actin, membranes and microtubules-like isoform X2 [Panonychus citri]
MMDSSSNSLEGWVAVKRNIFMREGDIDFGDSSKIKFLVAYNQIEQKLAITCTQGSRKASDVKPKSVASFISVQALKGIHNQLRIVYPALDGHFPANLESTGGFLPYLMAAFRIPEEVDLETCNAIEQYLEVAMSMAGKGLLLALLFDDDEDPLSDFEEDIQEMRLTGFENVVKGCYTDLEDVLRLRTRAKNMKELAKIWKLEDKVIASLSVAISEKYNFQLQPFLQLREMAHNHIKQAKERLSDPDFGNRVKILARKEIEEFNDQFLSANGALQHLYQEYYRKVVDIISGQMIRIKEDEQRFGKNGFDLEDGPLRLLKLQINHSQEIIKLRNTVRVTKEYNRDQLRKYLKSLDQDSDKSSSEHELKRTELDIINTRLEILAEEEKLIKKKLDLLAMQNSDEISDSDLFHDAVEETQDQLEEDCPTNIGSDKIKAIDILKVERQSIARRRAHLRNKKALLLTESKEGQSIQENEADDTQSQVGSQSDSTTIRASTRRLSLLSICSDEEKQREEAHKKIRKKTLQRLKAFRMRSQKFCDEGEFFQEKSLEHDERLPPYPWIHSVAASGDGSLPPPPDDVHQPDSFQEMKSMYNIENFPPQSSLSDETTKSKTIVDKTPAASSFYVQLNSPPNIPPPPPNCPPPPPPPPPPPAPFVSLTKHQRDKAFVSCMEKSFRGKSQIEEKIDSSSSTINLNDILNARGKLKKCEPITKEINEASQVAQNLMNALNKIRAARRDSDESEDEQDNSNDFD